MGPDRHRAGSPERKTIRTPRGSDLALPQAASTPRTTGILVENANPIFPRRTQVNTSHSGNNYSLSSSQILSRRARTFISEVPVGDWRSCRTHVFQYPEVLEEDNEMSNYSQEAIDALKSGNTQLAKNCVEKYLIRRDLGDRPDEYRNDYFRKLLDKDPKVLDHFEQDFAKAWAAVERTALDHKQLTERKPAESMPGYGAQPGRPSYSGTQMRDEKVQFNHQISQLKIDDASQSRGLRHREPPSLQDDYYRGGPLPSRTRDELRDIPEDRPYPPGPDSARRRHEPIDDGELSHDTGSQSTAPFVRVPSIRGHRGEDEGIDDRIDDRFYQRTGKQAREFWCEGRVFALIWHSEDTGKVPDVELMSEWQTKTAKGQIIRSHVTRMAVVRVGAGFVWAVPISTYGGRGVAKPGFRQPHIDAHAIIHDSQKPALYVAKEPTMKKHPVAVDLVKKLTLDKASRIDFAKVHTVEWNVRAMKIGMIASKSKAYFKTYWKEERDQ